MPGMYRSNPPGFSGTDGGPPVLAPPPDLLTHCQRWRGGRASYRPAGEPFDPRHFAVEPIEDRSAKDFVCQNHYSHSYVAARRRYGLILKEPFRPAELMGVAVFSVPMSQAVVPKYLGVPADQGVELGRFVLLDAPQVAANSESWFLSRALKQLWRDLPEMKGVVSFCDPLERRDDAGQIVKFMHRGTVYKATNALFKGTTLPRRLVMSRCGRVVSERALQKLRNDEQGAAYAYRQLVALGAPPYRAGEGNAGYLTRALAEGGFRRIQHPGNLGFVFARRKGI